MSIDPSIIHQQIILSPKQISFITGLKIPKHVTIQTDSHFDSVTSKTSEDKWRFVIGGETETFNFSDIEHHPLKLLIKYCTAAFINYGRPLRNTNFRVIKKSFNVENFTFDGFKDKLSSKELLENPEQYFATKGIAKLLCQLDFPGFSVENIGDFILIPFPKCNNPFLKYQDLENAFPSPLKSLIVRAIVTASKNLLNLSNADVENITLFGLSFYTGMRPVQFAKISVLDFKKDTSNKSSGLYRYSLNMPYAKQTRITNNKVKIALPAELGLLIVEYINRFRLQPEDRFILVDKDLTRYLNDILQQMLLSMQPKSVQEQIIKGDIILPRLTTYDFRHNVGHSLALAGASADEIAYMLGHSSLIAATYYISATPELAMLKSKALGDNPVWQNMINLLLTGYAVQEKTWLKRTVSGTLGGKLHIKIGGCERPGEDCTLAKVRSCYGCFYFRPFTDLVKHHAILDCINKEIIDTLEVSEKSGNIHNPALDIIANLKCEVQMVINRIKGGLK
ncbi:TPA: site-specific integrase [Aeromonas veronii]|uniref:site-specific integrase n=2 Tax=Aeromonas TaxID=642 RepID=UPI0034A30294